MEIASRTNALLILGLLLQSNVVSHAIAQDTATGGGRVALLELKMDERKIRGKLDACELTYLVAFEDYIYRRGATTLLRGNVSLMGFVESDKPPGIFLKVTAFDAIGNDAKLAPLGYAYLSVHGTSYAGAEFVSFTCEDGGLCVGYELLKHPELAAIGEGFQISFTRANGKTDVLVPISLHNDKDSVWQSFNMCSLKLFDVLINKLSQ